MSVCLFASKVGMTRIFIGGILVPVSVFKVKPNIITSLSTNDKGKNFVQITCMSDKKLMEYSLFDNHVKNTSSNRNIFRFFVNDFELTKFTLGTEFVISNIKNCNLLTVSSVSKGKGFAGVVKRHHFSGFPASHGTHEVFRGSGSIGQREKPGKVFKGKKMAGQLGNRKVTIHNLCIVRIIEKMRLILVRGSVAGSRGSLVKLISSDK